MVVGVPPTIRGATSGAAACAPCAACAPGGISAPTEQIRANSAAAGRHLGNLRMVFEVSHELVLNKCTASAQP